MWWRGKQIICSTLRDPVKDSMSSSPKRSSSSSLEVSLSCFLIIAFPVGDFYHLLFQEGSTNATRRVESYTGIITLASFPAGRAIIMSVETKAEVEILQ